MLKVLRVNVHLNVMSSLRILRISKQNSAIADGSWWVMATKQITLVWTWCAASGLEMTGSRRKSMMIFSGCCSQWPDLSNSLLSCSGWSKTLERWRGRQRQSDRTEESSVILQRLFWQTQPMCLWLFNCFIYSVLFTERQVTATLASRYFTL